MWKSGHDGWRQIGLPLGLEGLGDRPIWTTSRLAGARRGFAKKAAVEFASQTEPGAPRIARPSPIHPRPPHLSVSACFGLVDILTGSSYFVLEGSPR